MRVLITGAAGLIGHHLVEHLLKNTGWDLVLLVRLGGVGSLKRLASIESWPYVQDRITVVWHDLRSPISGLTAREIGQVDIILHLAALTHVDESILDPGAFVASNVVGTLNLLEFARGQKALQRFVQFSTDEVFGPAPDNVLYSENDRYNCTNPYSATKAAAEQLANSYANCYGIPVIITNTMNVFGERASIQKFPQLCMRKILLGETIQIHSDPTLTRPGSRFYIHARNVASAILYLLERAPGEGRLAARYNIRGEKEIDNLGMAQLIADAMGHELKYELVSWHASRPGHDLRYSLDDTKLRKLGWAPPVSFEQSLKQMVAWTLAHREWLEL